MTQLDSWDLMNHRIDTTGGETVILTIHYALMSHLPQDNLNKDASREVFQGQIVRW